MRKILCSTGALFPRTTPEKYIALGDMADKLNCNGFEFMVDSTMYENVHKLIQIVKPLKLWIPVVHCQKSLGESLCGMKAWFDETGYHEYRMTDEEDRTAFQNGIERFRVNLEIAGDFTVEATAICRENGEVDYDMLNACFDRIRNLLRHRNNVSERNIHGRR